MAILALKAVQQGEWFNTNINYLFYAKGAATKEINLPCVYTIICNLLKKDVFSRSENLF